MFQNECLEVLVQIHQYHVLRNYGKRTLRIVYSCFGALMGPCTVAQALEA